MKRLLFSTIALAALITPALATVCQTRVNDVPDIIVPGAVIDVLGPVTRTQVVGQSKAGPAHNGTPYTIATFCPKAAAKGTCTGESLSEFVVGPIFGPVTTIEKTGTEQLPDTVIVTPDDPEYRIGVQVPATRFTPSFWLGSNWKDGTCP
jgi:hypothetical protein